MELIILQMSKDELKSLIADAVKSAISEKIETPEQLVGFIKGIHELATFLGVSTTKAQKLKNEKVFEFWQDGRTILFDPEKVKNAMSKFSQKTNKTKQK
jgi:hypothetical protein